MTYNNKSITVQTQHSCFPVGVGAIPTLEEQRLTHCAPQHQFTVVVIKTYCLAKAVNC